MTTKLPSIDFEQATYEDLRDYGLNKLVMEMETQPKIIYSILQGHILIEQTIESLIKQNMKYPKKIFNHKGLGFKIKLDIAEALGIFPAEAYYATAKRLNDIRNDYTHPKDYDFKVTFEDLNSFKINWTKHQKKIYKVACGISLEEAVNIAIIFLVTTYFKLLSKPET